MKAVKHIVFLAIMFLIACTTPQERPIDTDLLIQEATTEAIQSTLDDEVVTFSIVWDQGRQQTTITESYVSLIPNDVPKIPLLAEDADTFKRFLKENRFGLLNATTFTEHRNPECRDGSIKIMINGIGKTVPIAGCATLSLTYKQLFEKLREIENRYYP